MVVVGLTGGSGSGKGYICSMLYDSRIRIIDTDSLYHGMISNPGVCVDKLVGAFGETILNSEGGIDRSTLGSIVFSDPRKLEQLNSITHALILDEVRKIISESVHFGYHACIVDAPLLFESGFDAECDLTVGVVAPVDVRIERIIRRDSITKEAALKRIKNQKNDDWFREKCDFIIENQENVLDDQIRDLVNLIKRLYEKKQKEKN